MTTTKITATIGTKLIQNADRYFTNSADAILDEMIQNARRAGAAEVSFEVDGSDLIIIDNGHGLASEKAHVLLALGSSNNDENVESSENAAGLGFFSLAHYDVIVASQNWSMSVPQAAFTGKGEASLNINAGFRAGMKIRICNFMADKASEIIARKIIGSVRYSGMNAVLGGFGDMDGTHQPSAFLNKYDELAIASQSETIHGVTIKIVRCLGKSNVSSEVNFFGKTISLKDRLFKGLDHQEQCATLSRDGKIIEDLTYTNTVLIDVHDTSSIQLQLPQRESLIESAGLNAIVKRVEEAYRKLLLQPGLINGVAHNHPVRKGAGASIPPASRVVHSISGRRYVSSQEGLRAPGDLIVPIDTLLAMRDDAIEESECSYFRSIFEAGDSSREILAKQIFELDDLHAAYGKGPWAELSSVTAVIQANGEEVEVVLGSEPKAYGCLMAYSDAGAALNESDAAKFIDQVVDEIGLILKFARPNGELITIAQPIPALFANPDDDAENPDVIIAKSHERDVSWRMLSGISWFNSDTDYDDQKKYYEGEYDKIVARITNSTLELFVEDLRSDIFTKSFMLDKDTIPADRGLSFSLTISLNEDGYREIKFSQVAA